MLQRPKMPKKVRKQSREQLLMAVDHEAVHMVLHKLTVIIIIIIIITIINIITINYSFDVIITIINIIIIYLCYTN